MQLGHTRLVHAQLRTDLFHRDFFVVVEADDAALTHRQGLDGGAHAILHFSALVGLVGPLRLRRHEHGGKLRFIDIVATGEWRGGLDRVDANDGFSESLLVRADRLREVGQRWFMPQRQSQLFACGLELPADPTHAAWPGIFPQSVDHRTAHPALGEGFEFDAALFIKALGGIDEADYAVLDEIAQVN
ncbi:MAG TPA: hypothetical protein VHK24_14975 [Steroidobacter sp.]|nr:hypothetical protein [Steroidobacter sp.]